MSRFTRSVLFTTQFDGDTVTMRIKRLKRKDAMKLAVFVIEDEASGVTKMQGGADFLAVIADVMPEYISDFSGVFEDGGEVVSFEDVLEEMYFMPLVGEIIAELMDISRVSEEDSGNSDEPSEIVLGGMAVPDKDQ